MAARASRHPSPLTGSPLHRLGMLHARITAGQRVSAETLARDLEVSSRTVKRLIERLREDMSAPIAWDNTRRTYYYSRPFPFLPLLPVKPDEAIALALASRVLAALHGPSLGKVFTDVIDRLAMAAGKPFSVPLEAFAAIVSSPIHAADDRELRHLWPLANAVFQRSELRMIYAKPGARAERRIVHPLALAVREQRWVLVAHDVHRDAVRTFRLSRIEELKPTQGLFDPPAGFDLQRYLRGSLGAFMGGDDVEVRIALHPTAALDARERPWHESQQLTPAADGRTVLTLRLNNLVDVEKWVLRCGAHAEVLSPPELRTRLRKTLAATLEQYGGGREEGV